MTFLCQGSAACVRVKAHTLTRQTLATTALGTSAMTDTATVPITDFAVLLDSASPGLDVPLYWNIHTTAFPAGEIRGQLVAQAASMPDAPPVMDPILPSV
jgi:hypothetical protein